MLDSLKLAMDLIEAGLGDWVATFDGSVLEVFTPYREGSMRYYARLLQGCSIDGTTLLVTFERREQGLWPFREDQRSQVEALVQAVNVARGGSAPS
jgi:hypothetical protein